MDIYLARHGLNDVNGEPYLDRERLLTPKGIKDVASVAARLKADGEVPRAIFASVFLRCMQSADILGRALGIRVIPCDELGPEISICEFVEEISESTKSGLMIMGHHTNIAELLVACGDGAEDVNLAMGEVRRYSCDPQGNLNLMYRMTPALAGSLDMKTLEAILRV